jgi:hypothetical protein
VFFVLFVRALYHFADTGMLVFTGLFALSPPADSFRPFWDLESRIGDLPQSPYPLLTHTFALDQIEEAYEVFANAATA